MSSAPSQSVNPAAERGPGNLPYARVGHASLTPYLAVDNAHAAHDFYVAAFGAMRLQGLEDAQGCIVHGPLRIGNALVVVNDAMPDVGLLPPRLGGMSTLLLFCPDADALYEQAVRAGARAVIPVTPMFSGDRHGLLVCPFGHRWIIATQMEHLSDETILSRWAELQSASHPSPAADPGPSNLPPNQEPAS